MSLITLNGVNVATAYVADLEKAVAFYEQILGFEKIKEMGEGMLMFLKAANLTLYLEGGRTPQTEADTLQRANVALCFNAKDGVRAAAQALESADIKIVNRYGDIESEFAGIQFCDPSGNLVEIAGAP